MMRLLSRDASGSVAIEFALIAPILVTMMLGIFQIGLGMQSYNAMRGASGDIARYSVVEYQNGNYRDTNDLTTKARTIATSEPYSLQSSRLTISVDQATSQRVSGTTEMTIAIQYNVPSVLSMIGVGDYPISYSRPVFLIQ